MPRKKDPSPLTYASSGVSIEEGDRFARQIQGHMRRTFGQRVIVNEGGFAGLFRLDYNEALFKRNYKDPVLVACTDGVGTKIRLAIDMNVWDTIGIDLVAMNVNDLVVQGAEPLLFLDYIACHKVVPEQLEQIVKGISEACRECDTALLGGETAEMSTMYAPGDIDLAGFALGVVELSRATDPERVEPGDVILGLESDGVHSNGYSLVHKVIERAGVGLDESVEALDPDRTVGECFLTPTRLYAPSVVRVLRHYKVKKVVTGMAHITGGGLQDNLARALREGIDAKVRLDAWETPRVFDWIQQEGNVDIEEMRHVFNMGIGFCMIVRPSFASSITDQLTRAGERVHTIGEVVKSKGAGGSVLTG